MQKWHPRRIVPMRSDAVMIPYRSRPPQSRSGLSAKGRRGNPYRFASFFRYTNQYAMPTATPPKM